MATLQPTRALLPDRYAGYEAGGEDDRRDGRLGNLMPDALMEERSAAALFGRLGLRAAANALYLAVVEGAQFRIGQDRVRFVDGGELLFGNRVCRIAVGMKLLGELAECPL